VFGGALGLLLEQRIQPVHTGIRMTGMVGPRQSFHLLDLFRLIGLPLRTPVRLVGAHDSHCPVTREESIIFGGGLLDP